jgi:hypothetical protein
VTTPNDDDVDQQTGDQDGDQDQGPPALEDLNDDAFTRRMGSFLWSVTGQDVDEDTDVVSILRDPDRMRGMEGFAAKLIAEQERRDGLRADAERQAREEQLRVDREAAKEALKKELAERRTTDERTAADEARRQELLAEIAAEEAASGGSPTDPHDLANTTIDDALKVVHDPSASPDQKLAAANAGIAAAASLEGGFAVDRTALDATIQDKLRALKEAR